LYDGEAPPTLGNLAERNWRKSVGRHMNHRATVYQIAISGLSERR
jgi:hypothetical protein